MKKKAAFLDRDGVINIDKGYVYKWDDFEFIEGSKQALKILQDNGYAIVIITNQSGIARGYYNEKHYNTLTNKLRESLIADQIKIDAIYHCPHHPRGNISELTINCDCRKPKPGMIFKAKRDLGLSLKESILIGDKLSDIQAGLAAGLVYNFLLRSETHDLNIEKNYKCKTFSSLLDCASQFILKGKKF